MERIGGGGTYLETDFGGVSRTWLVWTVYQANKLDFVEDAPIPINKGIR